MFKTKKSHHVAPLLPGTENGIEILTIEAVAKVHGNSGQLHFQPLRNGDVEIAWSGGFVHNAALAVIPRESLEIVGMFLHQLSHS